MDLLLLLGLIVGAIWLQARAIARWQGIWRWLAAAPLLLVAGDALLIVADTSADPTSHNLWPLELVMFGACGAGFVVVLWLVRSLIRL